MSENEDHSEYKAPQEPRKASKLTSWLDKIFHVPDNKFPVGFSIILFRLKTLRWVLLFCFLFWAICIIILYYLPNSEKNVFIRAVENTITFLSAVITTIVGVMIGSSVEEKGGGGLK